MNMGRKQSDETNSNGAHPSGEAISPQVEELLTYRIAKKSLKYMIGTITVIGGVLGYFGYNSVSEINRVENEVRQIKKDLISETEKLRESTRRHQEEFSKSQLEIDLALDRMKIYQDEFEEIRNSLAEKGYDIENRLSESRAALLQMNKALADLDTIQSSVDTKISGFDHRVVDFDSNLTEFGEVIEAISQKVFKSGSFVVKEKSETEIYGMDLIIEMRNIKGDRLRGFTVYESKYDEPIWGPRDIRIGDEIDVNGDQSSYKIVVRYVLQHWPGKDVAGLDILLSRD